MVKRKDASKKSTGDESAAAAPNEAKRQKQADALANLQRMRANIARERRIEMALKAGGWIGAFLIVGLLGYAIVFNVNAFDVVTRLEADSPKEIQEAFFGGAAWLILCSDSRKALNADGTIRDTYFEGAKLLNDPDFMKSKKGLVRTAVLDCSASLPSGKSTYERLSLNTTRTPVMFLSVGGDKPRQLAPALLKKPKKAKAKKGQKAPPNGDDSELGKPLALAVKKQFDKRYAVQEIRDAKQLLSRCVERKQCALFLGAGPLSKQVRKMASNARAAKPFLRWAYLDIGGTGYKLNILEELLVGNEDELGVNALRMVVFKEKRFTTMPQPERYPAEKVYRAFLTQALEPGEEESMPILKKIPTLKKAKDKKSSSSTGGRKGAKPVKEKSAATSGSRTTQEGMTPEEARAFQLKREKERRKQMEAEAKLYEPAFGSDDDEEEDDIDLDDNDVSADDEEEEEVEEEEEDEISLD